MHAAAAVGVPSVVIVGGFVSPDNTGYAMHTNLFVGPEPCGSARPCEHWRAAMKQIGVEHAIGALTAVWDRRAWSAAADVRCPVASANRDRTPPSRSPIRP